jgi:hypothetical protein
LFDITGRQVSELFNSYCLSGQYHVPVNTQFLKPGIYFYRMHIEGQAPLKGVNKMVVKD